MTATVTLTAAKQVSDNLGTNTDNITSAAGLNWPSRPATGVSVIFCGSLYQSGATPSVSSCSDNAGAMTIAAQQNDVSSVDFLAYKHNVTDPNPSAYINAVVSSITGGLYTRLSGLAVSGLTNAAATATGANFVGTNNVLAVSTSGNVAAGTYLVVTDLTIAAGAPLTFAVTGLTSPTKFGEEDSDAHIQGCGAWSVHTAPGGAPITATWTATGSTGDMQGTIAVFLISNADVTVNLLGAALASARGTIGPALAKTLTGQALPSVRGSIAAALAKTLTGQALPSVRGTISPAMSKGLTGQASPLVPGSIVRLITAGLTGQAMSGVVGLVGPDIAPRLTGQAAAASPGAIALAVSIGVNGQAVTTAAGSVAAALAVLLAGQSAPMLAGTVTFGSGTNVTVNLTGVSGALTPGQLLAAIARALTGASSAPVPGSVSPALAPSLTGAAAGATPGSVAPALAPNLTGAAAGAAPGALVPVHDVVLTGRTAALLPGTLGTPAIAPALIGAASTVAAGTLTAAHTVALAGASVAALLSSLASVDRALVLAGNAAVSVPGSVGVSAGQNVALTGQAATFALGIVRVAIDYPEPEEPVYSNEGWPASWNTRVQVPASQGQLTAGAGMGVAMGRFAWVDSATGQTFNARTSPTQLQGFVLSQRAAFNRVYFQGGRWWVRQGYPVTLCMRGEFWGRFEGGAVAGQRVHARLVDGALVSGYADGAEPTPYTVAHSCAPGELTIISSWSNYTP